MAKLTMPAKRLGGLQIDDELEFGRLLYRQIGGLTKATPNGLSVKERMR